jgi:hypothetical protein
MLELHNAWRHYTDTHSDIAIIGGDGSREQLVLDLRHNPALVMLVDITSSGWDSAIRQADDVSLLIDRIEAGTFAFDFQGLAADLGEAWLNARIAAEACAQIWLG